MTSRIEAEVDICYSFFSWQSILSLARQRQDMNVAEGLHERYGVSEDYADALHKHELGVAGEYSLCRHLGKPYAAALDRTVPADVGEIYQVRCVDKHVLNPRTLKPRGFHSLTAHPKDDDNQVFVLAVADFELRIVTLKGWRYGRDVKEPMYWRTNVRNACYMMPENHINPMDELPTEAHA